MFGSAAENGRRGRIWQMALFADDKRAAIDLYTPPPELLEGVRELVESANMGEMSQERANDLISFLLSAWLSAAVSQTVAGALERDIAQSLSRALQTWSENHGEQAGYGMLTLGYNGRLSLSRRRFLPPFPLSSPLFPPSPPSFPRKRESRWLATRNQVQTAVSGSPLPLWERARVRVRRALARLCGRTFQPFANFLTPARPSHP